MWFLVFAGILTALGIWLIFYRPDENTAIVILLWILSLVLSFGAGHNAERSTRCETGLYQLLAVDRTEGDAAYILVRDEEKRPRLFALLNANIHVVHALGASSPVRLTKDEDDKCHVYAE